MNLLIVVVNKQIQKKASPYNIVKIYVLLKLLQHATQSFKKIKLKNTNSVHNCFI